MENARKRSVKVLSFMLSLLVLYGSAGAVVSPLIKTESIAASADGSEKIAVDLQSVTTSGSRNAYVTVNFGNDYSYLTQVANAGVFVNGTKLNYNSSYSSLYYVNTGDCIVTGNTIQFHSSVLDEGENTVIFSDPDGGGNTVVRLKMSKIEVPPVYWYESTSYEYVVEVIEDKPQAETFTVTWKNGDTVIETDRNVENGTSPSFDGTTPVKYTDDDHIYTFAGWSAEENGDIIAEFPAVTCDVTYYAVFKESEKPQTEQQLYVRLTGSFEHKIIGQEDDVYAVSSATTGSASYFSSSSSAHVEYAFADKGTALEDVPEGAWHKPDYFKNGELLKVNGAASKIIIDPECEGIYGEINPFSGDLFLRGVPQQSGKYSVSVYLDTDKGSAVSNTLEFEVFSGNEKLIDRLTYDNCTRTADGKYMYDSKPWFMQEFGGENETVTVPKDIKAWYGSHAVLPEVNYSEIGRTVSLTNGEEPSQTLIIPTGCDLTMVNLRIHSGVKIVVGDGAKLTLRQTVVEGIIEVQNGGTFSMDYNGYGGGEWLHGSSVNGQLQMKDGSVLENARITCHANYSARDDENRRNFAPLVTTEGNVTVKGDVYILGEEAPTGETAQTALKVSGTLTVPEGSVLACYGGGTSFLTADGGDAIKLDNGTIEGAGSIIAIGGYGMSISGDPGKGSGGAAVSGSGKIAAANAYLEGGSRFHEAAAPIYGAVKIADTTNRRLVTGKGETTEKSELYWLGTGDPNGIVPQIEKTLAQIPKNAPAGVSAGKTSVKVTIDWADGADKHADDKVTAYVKDSSGKTAKTAEIEAKDNWSVTIGGLDAEKTYTVETDGFDKKYTIKTAKAENTAGDNWKAVGYGAVEEKETYLITYEDEGKTYMLGAQEGELGSCEWSGQSPNEVPDGYKWIPEKSGSSYYGQWFLMNQGGDRNTYLSMKQSGLDVIPCLYTKDSTSYYTLFADEDGSLWNKYLNRNLFIDNGRLSASESSFTKFTFRKKVPSDTDEFIVSALIFTKTEAKEPTCTEEGNTEYWYDECNKKYYSDENRENEIALSDTVIKATGHSYGSPEWKWNGHSTAKAVFTCADCGCSETVEAAVTSVRTEPTYTQKGKIVYTAKVVFSGRTYTSSKTITVPKLTYKAPAVFCEKGDKAVKLTWEAVPGAEKYAVAGYAGGKWQILDKGTGTSYVLNDLTPGRQYKIAVLSKVGGTWCEDYSNAIDVTPKAAAPAYPTVTAIDYNEKYHQFRLNWDAVDGAEKYGVVVYLAGRWKVLTQDISANTTTFTSPKLKAGQTYKMAVCAKINGVWDTNKIESRAFTVTVK